MLAPLNAPIAAAGFALVIGLSLFGSPALAQGERPWVDPPAPAQAGTASEPAKPAPPETGSAPEASPPPARRAGRARAGATAKAPVRRSRPRPASPVVVQREASPEPPRVDPSFDCRLARTSVERAICAHPSLAAKDRRMALLYEQAGGSRFGPTDPSQWRWLSARNACAAARGRALVSCVERAYDRRIAELSQ